MCALLGAYAYISVAGATSNLLVYHSLNFCGACCFVAHGIARRAAPVVVLNLLWALVALIAIGRVTFK